MDASRMKMERDLFLWRTLLPLCILTVTVVMLMGAHYPYGIFWEIAIPLYLAVQAMVFAGARRFGLVLGLERGTALLVSASAFLTAGLGPLVILMAAWRRRPAGKEVDGEDEKTPPD